jgi:hypothetical protein
MSDVLASPFFSDIASFCERWKIAELSLFGSALRDDFRADSDFDLLVTFAREADWGLFDHIQMQRELESMLHREVDLVSKSALLRSSNWLRRDTILSSARPLYKREAVHVT